MGVLSAALLALVPAPASADPSGGRAESRQAIGPLDAVPADSVVDSYGVGIHLNFLDTPYVDYAAVARALADLGVRHVRDDLFLDAPRQYAAIATVAREAGVRFDLILGRPDRPGTPEDYVRTVADRLPAGAVESLEGINEWDLFGNGTDWVTAMATWQQRLYTAAKTDPATADLPVLAPALAFRWNYSETGNLTPYADESNAHMYPGGFPPSNQITQITQAVAQMVRDKPLVTTEAGYHNAMNTTNGHLPVPEDVAGVYLPRLLLEHVLRGEKRVYTYELIDEFDDPGLVDPEAHFGLLRRDWSPKPAYTAMKNLLGLLADPGPSFAPGSLAVTADGLPADAHYLLTQKRGGRFVLLLWRDASIWDPINQQPQTVTPADVTLRLATAHHLRVYRPSDGTEPVADSSGTSLPLQLDGQVTAVTIDPVLPVGVPTRPRDVSAKPGDRSVTVTWRAAGPNGSPVTAYRLVAAGRKITVGPDRYRATIRRLPADRRLRVVVRAHNAAGWGPGARTPYVVTQGD